MINNYIDEVRKSTKKEAELKKRWNKYDAGEVEEYIKGLQDQINETEKVFKDSIEELRTNLLVVTRERDALLQDKAITYDYNNVSDEHLKTILDKRHLVALSDEVIKRVKNGLNAYSKKVKQLEEDREKSEEKYQELLDQFQKLQETNEKLMDEKQAYSLEKEQTSDEIERIKRDYESMKEGQKMAQMKCQEIFEITSNCLVSFGQMEEDE